MSKKPEDAAIAILETFVACVVMECPDNLNFKERGTTVLEHPKVFPFVSELTKGALGLRS